MNITQDLLEQYYNRYKRYCKQHTIACKGCKYYEEEEECFYLYLKDKITFEENNSTEF